MRPFFSANIEIISECKEECRCFFIGNQKKRYTSKPSLPPSHGKRGFMGCAGICLLNTD